MLSYATPGTKMHNVVKMSPNSVPLKPISYKDGGGNTKKYHENPIFGEKKVFIEESFYLVTTKTNLTEAYDYLNNLKLQIKSMEGFMSNMTFFAKKLKMEGNALKDFENDLISTLKLRVDVAEQSLRDMCIPPKHATLHVISENLVRHKRGLFNPVGKLLNLLWGQGDPDEIQEMVDWYETHKDENKKILETQGILLHLFQITNATINAQKNFMTRMNNLLISEKSEIISVEVIILSISRFQLIFEALSSFVTRAKFQIANGKNKFLTRSTISEDNLSQILQNITLQTNFKPPFKNINNYYNSPLSHVHERNCQIKQTLILPLINPQEEYSIEKTQPRFPSQILYVLKDKHRNYRFLTESDYEKCLRSEENSLVCNKRKIKIFDTQYGCTGTCPFTNDIFVHDLESAHIIAMLPNSTEAKIDCNGDLYHYELPMYSTFYLPEHCYMETPFFLIEQIVKIPIHVIPHKDVMLPTALTYNKAIETLQMHAYIEKNVTSKFEERMDNLTDSFDREWTKANETHKEAEQKMAEMDARYEALHFWHTYITTPLLIVLFLLLLIFCIVYFKLFKNVREKTSVLLRGLVSSNGTEEGYEEVAMKQLNEKYESVAKCKAEIKRRTIRHLKST